MTVDQLRRSHPLAVLQNHHVHIEWLHEVLGKFYEHAAICLTTSDGVPLIGYVPHSYDGVSVKLRLHAHSGLEPR